MRLLLAEDDPMIGEALCYRLRQEGFVVDWVQDGRQAWLALENHPDCYAVLLLDLGLPHLDGITLLKQLRRREDSIPVLILTARDAVADRVVGLNSGADDYLIKPFDLDELIARIHALARRHSGRARPVIEYGRLRVNPAAHEVTLAGRKIPLSAREFALLRALLEKPGAVLSRARLEDKLYGWNEEVESNAVEVHIHNLRKKLGREAILNVRGVGYRIAGD